MLKVHLLTTCPHCNGYSSQPIDEGEDCQGHKCNHITFSPQYAVIGSESKIVSQVHYVPAYRRSS